MCGEKNLSQTLLHTVDYKIRQKEMAHNLIFHGRVDDIINTKSIQLNSHLHADVDVMLLKFPSNVLFI